MEKYYRNCPKCNDVIEYSNKYRVTYSEKRKMLCAKCAYQLRVEKYGSSLEKIHLDIKRGERINGFQGKKHSDESLKKMRKSKKDMLIFKTVEYREKMSKLTKGNKNPMYGKSVFDIWVEKYGIDEAIIRNEIRKQKVSMKVKGNKNPMYGKETPKKSGNGISGWYKEFYFRSLHELKFILICERFNFSIKSAESLKLPYIHYNGQERTYSPDYIVNEKYLVEVKPIKLQNTPLNILKFNSGKKYSQENNLKFKVCDWGVVYQKELDTLIENKLVKLNGR